MGRLAQTLGVTATRVPHPRSAYAVVTITNALITPLATRRLMAYTSLFLTASANKLETIMFGLFKPPLPSDNQLLQECIAQWDTPLRMLLQYDKPIGGGTGIDEAMAAQKKALGQSLASRPRSAVHNETLKRVMEIIRQHFTKKYRVGTKEATHLDDTIIRALEELCRKDLALCDVCGFGIFLGGNLLTTLDIVSSRQYWREYFSTHYSELKTLGIRTFDDFKGNNEVRSSVVLAVCGQRKPWIICSNCVKLFGGSSAERRKSAQEWFRSGRVATDGFGPARIEDVNME